MSKIILLNGCGSSGKSSIAQAIQHRSHDLWLTFGVDSFIDMMGARQERYFKGLPGENAQGPTMEVKVLPEGNKLFASMPKFAAMLGDQGHNLIIDEVLFSPSTLAAYQESLTAHHLYIIGIFCDLSVMQEREMLRRDRCIGLSNHQSTLVHRDMGAFYDLTLDTTHSSPFKCAGKILDFLKASSKGSPDMTP